MSASPCIRGVLLDLSGTLHEGSRVIPGATEAIQALFDASLNIRILTNTSTVSSAALYQQLQEMGFTSIRPNQIYTSVLAMREYLVRHKLRPYCLLEDTSDFDGMVPLEPPHNAVVVGLAPSKFNYEHMNHAYQILQQYPNHLIAMHRSPYVKAHDGTTHLGPGVFVAALEAAMATTHTTNNHNNNDVATTTTVIVGKPSRTFYETVMWDSIPPEEICMVGDDVMQDIEGAQKAGIGTTLLVRTGKYRTGDEYKTKPTAVVSSIVDAVEYILETNRNISQNQRKR